MTPLSWLATAARDDLVRILRALVTEGGIPVQRRSDDRPAKCRFEPMIMGTNLGAKRRNDAVAARPRKRTTMLVMNLALELAARDRTGASLEAERIERASRASSIAYSTTSRSRARSRLSADTSEAVRRACKRSPSNPTKS